MEAIQIFHSEQFGDIRTAGNSDQPMFCLSDLCNILEIKNVRDCKSRLNQKGVAITDTPTNGGVQKMIYVNESNFYKVVFQSRKPEAETFTDWVASEVLPSIRKQGGYIASAPEETPEQIMARALMITQSTIDRIKEQSKLQQHELIQSAPKVEYFDTVLQSAETYRITRIAQDLGLSAMALKRGSTK